MLNKLIKFKYKKEIIQVKKAVISLAKALLDIVIEEYSTNENQLNLIGFVCN